MAGWNEWVTGANMTLSEVLDAFKRARIGLDVHDKFYWTALKIIELAIKEGNANFDVAKAAGAFKDLASRLDASDADMRNFNVNWINKNLGKLDQTFMTEDFLQQMAGTTPINAVPAERSLTSSKYALKSVTAATTDFIDTSTNLINVKKLASGLLNASGVYTPASDYLYLPDGLPCVPSGAYSHVGITHMTYFNAAGAFINRLTVLDTPTFYALPNAVRMVPNVQTSRVATVQINEGSTLLPYESYYQRLGEDINLAGDTIDTDMLIDKSVTLAKTDFVSKNKLNLLDNTKLRSGYYNASGNFVQSANYLANNADYFIEIEPNAEYVIPVDNYSVNNASVFIWYTESKELIRRDSGTSPYNGEVIGFVSKAPNHAKYLKVNLGTHYGIDIESACLYKGNKLLNTFEFKGNFAPVDKAIAKPYKFSINKVAGNFPHIEVTGIGESGSSFSGVDAQHSEIYALFDGLLNTNSTYMSRALLGTSTLGNPIYVYDLKPESSAITSGPDSPYPTIILLSSIHGGEALSTFTLYETIKAIVRKWEGSEQLEYLRHYVNFKIVPLPNPDDFNSRSYIGLNDINLNRDFDINWKTQTGAHTGPNQRVESSIMQTFLKNNRDAICFIDCHVRGNSVEDNQLMWMESLAESDTPITKDTIETMTRLWKIKYPELKAVSGQLGYATAVAGGTTGGSGTVDSYGHFVAGVNNILWEGFKSSTSINNAHSKQVVEMNVQYLGQTIISVIKNYQ